jgi:hypothetical protein
MPVLDIKKNSLALNLHTLYFYCMELRINAVKIDDSMMALRARPPLTPDQEKAVKAAFESVGAQCLQVSITDEESTYQVVKDRTYRPPDFYLWCGRIISMALDPFHADTFNFIENSGHVIASSNL